MNKAKAVVITFVGVLFVGLSGLGWLIDSSAATPVAPSPLIFIVIGVIGFVIATVGTLLVLTGQEQTN